MRERKSRSEGEIWQRGIELIPKVYKVLGSFPEDGRFSLAEHIQQLAIRIPLAIGESQMEQRLQGLYVARRSLAELGTLLMVARRLGYISPGERETLIVEIRELRVMLLSLIITLKGRTPDPDLSLPQVALRQGHEGMGAEGEALAWDQEGYDEDSRMECVPPWHYAPCVELVF